MLFDWYFFAFTQLLDGKDEWQVAELLMYTPEPIGQLNQSQGADVVNGAPSVGHSRQTMSW